MPSPDDPRHLARLCLGRLLWLSLPEARRRSLLVEALELLGANFGPPREWVERQAWTLAGILDHRLDRLILSREHAASIARTLGHLLAEDAVPAASEAIGAEDGRREG